GVLRGRGREQLAPAGELGAGLLGRVVVDQLDVARGLVVRVELRVVALTLERVGQHVPRRPDARHLVAVRLQLRVADALLLARAPEVGDTLAVRLAELFAGGVGLDAQLLVVVVGHDWRRSFSSSTRPSIGTRSCDMESRSRMVTARSSRVSKSTVT